MPNIKLSDFSGEVARRLVRLVWEMWQRSFMLLRELLVRPAWQGQRVGKRMYLTRQKPNWPERERYTVLWE